MQHSLFRCALASDDDDAIVVDDDASEKIVPVV
jgi:hypothetical protein